jgi:hypothetical protein
LAALALSGPGPLPAEQIHADHGGAVDQQAGEPDAEGPQHGTGNRVPATRPAIGSRTRQHELGGVDDPERDDQQPQRLTPGTAGEAAPVVGLEDPPMIGRQFLALWTGSPEEAALLIAPHLDNVRAEQHALRR